MRQSFCNYSATDSYSQYGRSKGDLSKVCKNLFAAAQTLTTCREMMFTKYLVVVDDECLRTATNVHNTSEIASGSKLGIDATKKLPGRRLQTPLAAAPQDG
jgi:3-polyprenyl-4-hydroxybenzoate decarboxylase